MTLTADEPDTDFVEITSRKWVLVLPAGGPRGELSAVAEEDAESGDMDDGRIVLSS